MNLLSLGTAQRRLFAIHEAAAPSQRTRAAVLCQPLGAEYTYAHRSMRQLAVRLALSGIHALRFDYYGTGDSAGLDSEPDLAGCESDVASAMEALADIAGTARLTLIGLRAGANIAAHVAARHGACVEALVLWDPMPSQDLRSLSDALPPHSTAFVTDSAHSCEALRATGLGSGARAVPIEFVPTQCPWVESATISGMLPVAVFQRMIEWLN